MFNWLEKILSKILSKFKKEKIKPLTVEDEISDLYRKIRNYKNSIQFSFVQDLMDFDIKDDLGKIISDFRQEWFVATGFILEPVRVMSDYDLQENEFRISIHDELVYVGYTSLTREKAVNEIKQALITICNQNVNKLFSIKILSEYMNELYNIDYLMYYRIRECLDILDIRAILANIVKQGKSIRDISYIFEKIYEYIPHNEIYPTKFTCINPRQVSSYVVSCLR